MPYCLTHGFQQGKHCSECGAPLSETPSAAGDSVSVRSPEAHAHASANPTFVLPGGHVETRPAYAKCPRCGHYKPQNETFECHGNCGRDNLCLRHFDEEYEVCVDCARTLRGEAKAEAERQAKLLADLATWRQLAEDAEARVDELMQQRQQAQETLQRLCIDLEAEQKRARSLELELSTSRDHIRQTEVQFDKLLKQARDDLREAQGHVHSLEQDHATLRSRTEHTEVKLQAELAQQCEQTRKLKARLEDVEQRLNTSHANLGSVSQQVKQLTEEQTKLHQRIRDLDLELTNWRKRAIQAENLSDECTKRIFENSAVIQTLQKQLDYWEDQTSDLANKRASLELKNKNLESHVRHLSDEIATWRDRADKAEEHLIVMERAGQETAAKPVAAAAAGNVFARLPNPAMTSGGYTVEEIAQRRVVAYHRYKARKGLDAKLLHGAGEAVAAT